MKVPPLLPARSPAAFGALVLFAAGAAFAEIPGAPLREGEQKQAQIQGDTKALAESLDAMLGEYERNNLAGDDAAAVRRVRESLGRLSAGEMRQVVDLLQRARAASRTDAVVRTVADAFSAQKQIVVAIQRILDEHLREREAGEISRQLHSLADRQARNLQNGIELARMTAEVLPARATALLQAQLEAQRGEQAAIAAEVKIIRGRIARLAANPDSAETAGQLKAAAQQLEKTEPVAEAAAQSLAARQLFKAATDEKTSRDELRRIARQIAPRDRGPEALRAAEREVGEIIAEQRQLREGTAQQRRQADFDKWLGEKIAAQDQNGALPQRFRGQPASALHDNPDIRARFENEQRQRDAQFAKMEDQQAELAGKTDALAQKIAEAPQAAGQLAGATGKMQEARAAMLDSDAPQAAQQQGAAIEQLEKAHAELKRRADEAEALTARSGDNAKDLEQLQQVAETLAREESAIARDAKPDAAAQVDLARRAEQLAQRAAMEAPQAEQPVQAGANEARKAGAAMQAEKAGEAREAAQQAAQNFSDAAKELGRQAQAAKAGQQMNHSVPQNASAAAVQMAAAQEQLAQLQQQLQQAEANLQQAAQANGQKAAQTAAQAAQQAAQAAQQAGQAAQVAQQQAAQAGNQPAAQQAAQAVEQANEAARAAGQAAQNAQQVLSQLQPAVEASKQAAKQAGQAAAAAQQAARAARDAQQAAAQGAQQAAQAGQQAAQNSNQEAARQAGSAATAAQQAAQAAQQARQMAQASANAAKSASQQTQANAAQQQAAQQLAQASQGAGRAASQGSAKSSPVAQQAMQQAAKQLSAASLQAAGGKNGAAQQSARQAAQSLAQAQAAVGAMQAGLSPSQNHSAMAGAPMAGSPGRGQQGAAVQPGQGRGTGKDSHAANGQSQGAESYTPGDPKAIERGAREAALKKADFIGLPARERAAIQQSLREKYPGEYGALVEQYLLNLANESARR